MSINQAAETLCKAAILSIKPLTDMRHSYRKGRIVQSPLPGCLVWLQGRSLQLGREDSLPMAVEHSAWPRGVHLQAGFLLLLLFSVLDLGLIFLTFQLLKQTVSVFK